VRDRNHPANGRISKRLLLVAAERRAALRQPHVAGVIPQG